ncbi:insulinase family protein [Erythrobacteraceae bacterium CFH 75059]|uniref:M16 family metallopeptidase n=1 Tax=Qipengyuania thermophila TaxID=2509361 RepID=UPI00101EB85B|nr:M16 family metallopeptidase [Qipengyuania thermophila]TCD02246.1 insulinase family protein [Erythrobacteraceae bacterium CFH 75059]
MTLLPRALRRLALLVPALALLAPPLVAQQAVEPAPSARSEQAAPRFLQPADAIPWLYEGSDVPRDPEWLFGRMDNGLRYAVRRNGVPPGQVAIRVRIDAGSLHEADDERGFAHFIEHLLFRESRDLGPGQAIPTWQRLGATFGSDTNAETTPTQTVYKLDLPAITPDKLRESVRLLSGMVREPVLSEGNIAAELPIVLAEMRESQGPALRAGRATRETLFAGQRLASRVPIGTEETLRRATPRALQAFHARWYRPENTVIVVAGDLDPLVMAAALESAFADWRVPGVAVAAPSFGDPRPPRGARGNPPVGETRVIVEPDLPRTLTYAVLRPWRPVQDTIAYNEGLLVDALAQALINRRLEARARAGGSFLYAQVQQDDVSRSADATFVTLAPLGADWRGALSDVRGVIADALATPPSREELEREIAELEIGFRSSVEQSEVLPGATLADQVVQAVDIRETVASPDTVLAVFSGMKDRVTPEDVLRHTRALFTGTVLRAALVTPAANEATAAALRTALAAPAAPAANVRLDASAIRFDDLPAIGEPGRVVRQEPTGLLSINQVEFANGVKALLWSTPEEPGRVTVKVRFGAGYGAFAPEAGANVALGKAALIGMGLGTLGQEELDRISTGRRMGFDFEIGEGSFSFSAQTRRDDLADQLYLFAAKLAMPRWDPNPLLRARAAAQLAYASLGTSPAGVLQRDLEWVLRGRDPRFASPAPATLEQVTPETFRATWEPVLASGPVEVLIFGDFDEAAAVESLRRTFGALAPRPAATPAATPPAVTGGTGAPVVLTHRGERGQAAAVMAWNTGGGVEELRTGRQLEILTQLFNNRLFEALRERLGASYSPSVGNTWPADAATGGRIVAAAQLRSQDVPVFFEEAERIAAELASAPPSDEELALVTEPLRQLITRVTSGNAFWMMQLEGATRDPRLFGLMRSVVNDYSRTTPEAMNRLAARFLAADRAVKVAVLPEGEALAVRHGQGAAAPAAGAAGTGR